MPTNQLGFPTIEASQNLKFATHNESINLLESVAVGVVQDFITSVPLSPNAGDLFITQGATFTGNENDLAYYDGTTLFFFVPVNGLVMWIANEMAHYRFNGTTWELASVQAITQATGTTPTGTPNDGTMVVDTTGTGTLYVRVAGVWRSTPLI